MSSPYELFGTDSDREKGGIELDYGDFQIRVARAGGSNRRYFKVLEQKSKPIRRALATGTANPQQVAAIMREVFAETVVLGWTGVTDREGNDLPFTKDNAVQLFKDLPDLFADIQNQASSYAQFLEVQAEADEGN